MFGSLEVEPEEELDLLKQILFAELPSKLISKSPVSSFHISQCSENRQNGLVKVPEKRV